MSGTSGPPVDPEVARAKRDYQKAFPDERPMRSAADIESARAGWPSPRINDVLRGRRVRHEVHEAPGYGGAPIFVSVFSPAVADGHHAPGVYLIHGGAFVLGDRHHSTPNAVELVEELGVVVATVEYRLAPEFPDPVPVEDCYAGLCWFAEQASSLGLDLSRLLVMGGSAGGGLAAGVALMARDRQGPSLAGQVLVCPALDDRLESVSAQQFAHLDWSDGDEAVVAWTALLGERRATRDVSPYAAPARATDLTGLAPAFLDVGSAEAFRDEVIAYASAIWAAGGEAELHVWSGGIHGFDHAFPQTTLARSAIEVRHDWLRRLLARSAAE